MYILESPQNLQVAFGSLVDTFADMMRKALLYVTTFLASTGLLSLNGSPAMGVQAQYLLGLGKCLIDACFILRVLNI